MLLLFRCPFCFSIYLQPLKGRNKTNILTASVLLHMVSCDLASVPACRWLSPEPEFFLIGSFGHFSYQGFCITLSKSRRRFFNRISRNYLHIFLKTKGFLLTQRCTKCLQSDMALGSHGSVFVQNSDSLSVGSV